MVDFHVDLSRYMHGMKGSLSGTWTWPLPSVFDPTLMPTTKVVIVKAFGLIILDVRLSLAH